MILVDRPPSDVYIRGGRKRNRDNKLGPKEREEGAALLHYLETVAISPERRYKSDREEKSCLPIICSSKSSAGDTEGLIGHIIGFYNSKWLQ